MCRSVWSPSTTNGKLNPVDLARDLLKRELMDASAPDGAIAEDCNRVIDLHEWLGVIERSARRRDHAASVFGNVRAAARGWHARETGGGRGVES